MGDSSLASGFRSGFGSAFLQFALERFATFGDLAWKEIRVIWGVEDELRKLQRTFWRVQELVDHMEGSLLWFLDGSNAWHLWFEDLRRLAYEAEALLDHISLHLSIYCMENPITANEENRIRSMVLSSPRKWNLPDKICQMQRKLEGLAKEMEGLLLGEKLKSVLPMGSPRRPPQLDNCHSRASSVVGRVQDKNRIVNLLDEDFGRGNFSAVWILGMAGIGKTTLAQFVYDDVNVCRSFEKRIWVSISIDFDVARTTKSIIEAATPNDCNLSDLSSLQVRLQDILREKKFLLVLDGYWSENLAEWNTLSSPFSFGSRGSKIIITTRSMKLKSIVSSSRWHKLELLLDDDCWELIKQRATNGTDANQNLEHIGRQIANKCEGLPLAAVILGSELRCKSTEEEWQAILESKLGDMPQSKDVLLTLMLSYLKLPANLRRCFAYCSIFPQNHEFEVEELVFLWKAEGFIQPVSEDLGNDYFNDLYTRSFFQECTNASHEKMYKMHELIHDMARLVSKDICSHVKYSTPNSYPLFGNAYHLYLLHDEPQTLKLKASLRNERLRTFLVRSNNANPLGEIDPQLFLKLKFLRVLGLGYIGLEELPSSIENLIYLRYLNLSGNLIVYLSESVCKLVALEVLKLRNCSKLCKLPKQIGSLRKLRHLEFDASGKLQSMPLQFGKLINLQTLSACIVEKKSGYGIGELQNMNCLRGSLCIKNLNYVSNFWDVVKAKLQMKESLYELELHWETLRDGLDPLVLDQKRNQQGMVFANLQPHRNLKQLVIKNYCGVMYPGWLSEPWRKFTSIELKGLQYCDSLPCLGQLPFLKSFVISDLPCLEHIERSFYATINTTEFPSLESFQLVDMSRLIHWRYVSDHAMPLLITFTIKNCPMLENLPQRLRDMPNSIIRDCPSLD